MTFVEAVLLLEGWTHKGWEPDEEDGEEFEKFGDAPHELPPSEERKPSAKASRGMQHPKATAAYLGFEMLGAVKGEEAKQLGSGAFFLLKSTSTGRIFRVWQHSESHKWNVSLKKSDKEEKLLRSDIEDGWPTAMKAAARYEGRG